METWFTQRLASIWPQFMGLELQDRRRVISELFGLVFILPWAIITLFWISRTVQVSIIQEHWITFIILVLATSLADQLFFFQITETKPANYTLNQSSLSSVISLAAGLLFGPTWLAVIILPELVSTLWRLRRRPPLVIFSIVRQDLFGFTATSLSFLGALWIYQQLGGVIPLAQPTWSNIIAAMIAISIGSFSLLLPFYLFFKLLEFVVPTTSGTFAIGPTLRFAVSAFVLPSIFAILLALVINNFGLPGVLFGLGAILATSFVLNRMSRAHETMIQRTAELDTLEQLGRVLLSNVPSTEGLRQALAAHVPSMFRYRHLQIQLLNGPTLVHIPEDRTPWPEATWEWLHTHPEPFVVAAEQQPPWDGPTPTYPLILMPIFDLEQQQLVGGIVIEAYQRVYQPQLLLSAMQALARQIASALHQAIVYQRMVAYERSRQELEIAGQIQQSFLPQQLPSISGWEIAATLRPARQTSGDFYDLVQLPNNHLAIIIADVSDKGSGAALFMAMSRTLFRTYAYEYPAHPATVLQMANQRILRDTHSSMFVTAWYGVLDPASGVLHYASAGHNPPLLHRHNSRIVEELPGTGIPLGIEQWEWHTVEVHINHGDRLILYTDGISEAQNQQGDFYGMPRFRQVIDASAAYNATEVMQTILSSVEQFAAEAPQADDMSIVIVGRGEVIAIDPTTTTPQLAADDADSPNDRTRWQSLS